MNDIYGKGSPHMKDIYGKGYPHMKVLRVSTHESYIW